MTSSKKLSPTQRKKIEARAAQLIAEEVTLRELEMEFIVTREEPIDVA